MGVARRRSKHTTLSPGRRATIQKTSMAVNHSRKMAEFCQIPANALAKFVFL
jgi:hypothetical protein